jgi:GntR family transcriptional regulator
VANGLNRSIPVPLYYQLQGILTARIDAGEWQAGELLPSESALCESYSVSRTVVRQALEGLVRAGLVFRVKGRGAFVAERKIVARLLQTPTGFEAQMVAQGLGVRTDVLLQESAAATGRVAASLEIEEGAPVLRLERLRYVDDVPVFYGETFVPLRSRGDLAGVDFTRESLNSVLARLFGQRPMGGRRTIETIAAGQREAELLRVRLGAPLFQLFAVTRAQDGRPMECSRVWLRGDCTAFEVDLAGPSEPEAR